MVVLPQENTTSRRSIYLQQRRVNMLTMLDLFDYPQMGPNCIQRTNTAVAPQALFLLNDTIIRSIAESLARRVKQEAGNRLADQVEQLYWRKALFRVPEAADHLCCSQA